MRVHLFSYAFVLAVVCGWTTQASAQHPKLDLSFFVGAESITFTPQAEGEKKHSYAGLEIGGGLRVRRRRAFIATALTFRAWGLSELIEVDDGADVVTELRLDITSLSLECPMLIGFIPYKDPYFKIFLYGGYVNQFNTRFVVSSPGLPTESVSPRKFDFAIYQALMRFGVGFDVTLFHFNFAYSIGLNSATHTETRTNVQLLQFDLGILF